MAFDALDARGQMFLALAAYATYVINATQFLLKLRAARRSESGATLRRAGGGTMSPPEFPLSFTSAASAKCSAA